ncbi:MAG: right-handed parallel beta-helix repeat-containing protein [Planctomycetota bacterium]|jgi:hypothetical protein
MKNFQLWLASLLAPLTPLAHADITVLPDGSVGPVVGLAQALAIAQPGETLYLMPGDYAGVTIDGQAVNIIGAGRDLVTVGTPAGSSEAANLFLRGLARDQAVILAGMTLDQRSSAVDEPTLFIDDCEGLVVLHDLEIDKTAAGSQSPLASVWCRRSTRVLIDHCTVRGFVSPISPLQYVASATSVTHGSHVDFNHCQLLGGTGGSQGNYFGSNAVGANVSSIRIHGGVTRGGDSLLVSNPSYDYSGGAGISLSGADLVLSGGPGTVVQGGNTLLTGDASDKGGFAIIFTLGKALIHTGVQLEPGYGGTGIQAPTFNLESPAGLSRENSGQRRPGLSVTPPSGAPGAGYELDIQGTPGRLQTIVVARELTAPFNLAGYTGLSYLDPSQAFDLITATTDGNGVASMQISTPAIPELIGQFTWYQSFEIQDPDGRPLLGLPTGYRFM